MAKKKNAQPLTPHQQRLLEEIEENTVEENQHFLDKWEYIRRRGRLRYIALRGFLPFGVGITALMAGLVPLIQSGWDILFYTQEGYSFRFVIIATVAYFVGYLAGKWLWTHHETKYALLRERYPKVSTPWDDPALLSPADAQNAPQTRPANKKKR